MSKYSSLCTAINIIEAIDKVIGGDRKRSNTETVISDLQSVAQDVRYGGEWHGDFAIVAEALNCCVETGSHCAVCPYRRDKGKACIPNLKNDAAAAIRQLGKNLAEARAEIQEVRETAAWQQKDMENGNTPPDVFPWDDDEEDTVEMAPAEEGEVF